VPPADLATASATSLPPATASGSGACIIRPLASIPELRACVELQGATWGEGVETVPVTLLAAATHVGGLVLGALAPDDTLLGFVFSLAGWLDGERVHWSHMLAVRESARGGGIGRALKERQRDELARRGVSRIYWTFDPLQARNAHLNLDRLGARVVEYVEDMYGVTRSPLHLGTATDRLIVAWDAGGESAPSSLHVSDDATHAAPLLIEIPWDVQTLASTAPETVATWRSTVRAQFQSARSDGYAVSGFRRDVPSQRAWYVLLRAPPPPDG
jgi:predicted GNAT superfamily acetyltransferase